MRNNDHQPNKHTKNPSTHLRGELAAQLRRQLMDNIGVQIPGGIDVTHQNRKRFGRRDLLGAHVGGTETVAGRCAAGQIDGVRHLEVIAEALLDDQLGALEGRWHHVCTRVWSGGKFICFALILYW